eukprot:g1850.t1
MTVQLGLRLDPDEALNLELFEQVLWIRTGFDLLQTWGTLDPHNQTVLTLPEFVRGCRALGFEGDAHHLFKGLDHQGLGRVSWHDFEYLQKLCDASSCAKGFTLEVRLLRSWAVEVCADLMELLRRHAHIVKESAVRLLEKTFIAGPAKCTVAGKFSTGLAASPACALSPNSNFPGGTPLDSASDFASGLVPVPLQCWPHWPTGEPALCKGIQIETLEVTGARGFLACRAHTRANLQDTATGWPGTCLGLHQVTIGAEDCESSNS